MSAAHASTALAGYLKSVSAVSTIVGGRVFRPQLDPDDDASMPRACIVVRHGGGYTLFGGGYVPVGDPRLDVFCYGATWLEAEAVSDEVVPALRALRSFTYEGTRLYWARIEGGPNPYEDPETNWPALVVSAQVALCEIPAA